MDRRLTPATARVAHVSLKGMVKAPVFVEGEVFQLAYSLVPLLREWGGPVERQLWLGDRFTLIDRDKGLAFGFCGRDGYCGWVAEDALEPLDKMTHWVASVGTHRYDEPRVQAQAVSLPHGARLKIVGKQGKFAETQRGFVPASHLRKIGDWLSDPVAVAEGFLGTPYLWGGNSRAGIDCSGLVQAAYLACGIGLGADSDLQESAGMEIPEGEPLRRGDLLFWKGHVALVVDGDRLIHANGHTMSVAYEGIDACIARVQAAEGLPVRSRRRL